VLGRNLCSSSLSPSLVVAAAAAAVVAFAVLVACKKQTRPAPNPAAWSCRSSPAVHLPRFSSRRTVTSQRLKQLQQQQWLEHQ